MKFSRIQQIFFYLLGLLFVFTAIATYFILQEEYILKQDVIKSRQMAYVQVVDEFIAKNKMSIEDTRQMDDFLSLFPDELRLSVIDPQGNILYHNKVKDLSTLDNQNASIEVKRALIDGEGWSNRVSSVSGTSSIFYAYYDKDLNVIIRIGLPFTDQLKQSMSPGKPFIFIASITFLCVAVLFFILFYQYHLSFKKLKDYILSFGSIGRPISAAEMPQDLRELSGVIKQVFDELKESEDGSTVEKEKLLEHFHYSEEGISFFNKDYTNLYTNSYFIQYLNSLLNEPTFDVQNIFNNSIFSEVTRFIENPGDKTEYSTKVFGNGCHYFVRVIIFEDRSFEIIIRDVTEIEKEYYDKAELTNNIAHEIKTPITSIRGYLETIMEHENLPPAKMRSFVERCHVQTLRLSEIIQDVILLSKTGDARNLFEMEKVDLYDLLTQQVKIDCMESIRKTNANIVMNLQPDVAIMGNKTLLYSLFFNLGTNALKYAGENVTITINNYMEDEQFYYFSFADNGVGIDEKHLTHIFERFYRAQEGRTRDKGGSGLGLSIVKDAVTFHNGTILAKNRPEGGLEYLFTLRKY